MNETHDPQAGSWVASANQAGCDFPIQNLPFGVFLGPQPTIGVAIGDQILDLRACAELGWISEEFRDAAGAPALNGLMALAPDALSRLRRELNSLLREGSLPAEACLIPMRHVEMQLPAQIGDYTDFYASIHHATNVGKLFRPDQPLLPNYKYVPIGYHGRASSIVPSGHPVRRPGGQRKEAGSDVPSFGPTRALDYELEVGCFVGRGNALGQPIPIGEAASHLFGLCLLNDWSARDIQAWEYQPLGPFLGKSFATTISPWVVTLEALEPFRAPAAPRPPEDPALLPYLDWEEERRCGAFDITLEVHVGGERKSRGNFRDLYWTLGQLLTHHASNGCNLRPGDLLASGTVSGPDPGSRGCLLEMGRGYLKDGDEVIFRGYCERAGYPRIGFGECRGTVIG